MAQDFSTTIGLTANATSTGQPVDFDGTAVSNVVITNASGASIQYSLDGSTWFTVPNTGVVPVAVSAPSSFRLRKTTSDSYPISVGLSWTSGDSSYNPGAVAITGGTIDGVTITESTTTAVRLTTPDQVGTLALWLDASQPMFTASYAAVVSALGDQISIWPDASGNGRAANASATKPTYDPTGLNGRPTVKFNGNSTFATGSFLDSTFNAGFTLMIVGSTNAGAGNKVLFGTASNGLYVAQDDTSKAIGPVFSALTPAGVNVQSYVNTSGVFALNYTGTSTTTEYDQLFKLATGFSGSATTQSGAVVAATGTLGLTGAITIGDLAGGGFTWPGSISEVILWKGALTAEQFRQMHDYLIAKWGFTTQMVLCAGNSLTSGTGSTGGATQAVSTAGTNYPSQMWAALGSTYTVRTDAYPGRTTSQMLTETPSFGDLYFLKRAARKSICVVWEVTNTLSTSLSRAAAYNQLVAYCKARRTQGFKVVVVTCLPRQDGVYAGFEVDRLAVNALILANWSSFADAVADVGGDSRLQNPLNTTYFSADKVHLTDAGYAVVASIIKPVVAAFRVS